MSGSGTNLRKILDLEKALDQQGGSPFTLCVLFSNASSSNVGEIASAYNLPYVLCDMKEYYGSTPLSDMGLREEFDTMVVDMLTPYECSTAVLGGYMARLTKPFYSHFLGINIHPGDLSVTDADGSRLLTGLGVVKKALHLGHRELRSTVHLVEDGLDLGPILSRSSPLEVTYSQTMDLGDDSTLRALVSQYQKRLKEEKEWILFPQTLLDVALGRYAVDEDGQMYFDGQLIPGGRVYD